VAKSQLGEGARADHRGTSKIMHQPLEALLVLRMWVLENLVGPKSKWTHSAPPTISSGPLEVRIYVNLCITRGQYLQALPPLGAHNSKVNITTLASKSSICRHVRSRTPSVLRLILAFWRGLKTDPRLKRRKGAFWQLSPNSLWQ